MTASEMDDRRLHRVENCHGIGKKKLERRFLSDVSSTKSGAVGIYSKFGTASASL